MKKLFFAATLLNASVAMPQVSDGDYAWVSTAFWSAPQVRVMEGSITPESKASLISGCEDYDVRVKSLSLPLESNVIRKIRVRDLQAMDGKFVAKFLVEIPDREVALENLAGGDKLPYYIQTKTKTRAFIEDASDIRLEVKSESYTQLSRDNEIEDSEYTFDYEYGKQVLTVYGKDVACDLLSGQAKFEVKAGSSVTLDSKNLKAIQVFYMDKIQPALNEVLSKDSKQSQIVKSARLGFKFGKHISDLNQDRPKHIEVQIENLMNLLFQKDSLKVSSVVVDSVQGKRIEILPSTEGQPVALTLTVTK